jgi:hypothetical protein
MVDEDAGNDTNGTLLWKQNINGEKDILLTEKVIICKIVFCGLATRSVNILIEMPIAENSIHY